jgi:MinD-like ATPase involved in chromosome partitioning or flagellar assembly
MDIAEDEGVDVSDAGYAAQSPWNQPPIHRPAPRTPQPEPVTPPESVPPAVTDQTTPQVVPATPPSVPPPPAPHQPPALDPYPPEPTLFQPRRPAPMGQPPAGQPVMGQPPPPGPLRVPAPAYRPPPDPSPATYRPPPDPSPPTYRPPPDVDDAAAPAVPAVPVHPYPDLEVPMAYRAPTAEEFATRRAVRPREWVARTGVRAVARRGSFGLVRLRPNQREREGRVNLSAVRRAFGGLRQITVVNPKGGAGKTVATLMLALTYGQTRGGFVLAWDNNETQGTLGMRAQPDLHGRTVRDLLRDLDRFAGGAGRIGELAAYVRAQEDAMFDVLASDEAAAAGEMLTARAFREIRDVVGRFYKMIMVDTGNNVRAENWQAAVDATDQLVITMSARNDSAETAARLLDHLEQTGRRELVRRAVTVVTMPPHRKEVDPRAIERHFDQRCRVVLRVPYDRHLDSGAPVRYAALSPESRRGWLRVAAAVADGL